ncbi:MAG: hypothetical protein FWC64_09430 [Treponema sp.]|nr:hypothetical protein [Treponema sp.]
MAGRKQGAQYREKNDNVFTSKMSAEKRRIHNVPLVRKFLTDLEYKTSQTIIQGKAAHRAKNSIPRRAFNNGEKQ